MCHRATNKGNRLSTGRVATACAMWIAAFVTCLAVGAEGDAGPAVEIRRGSLPIILSAPHGGGLPIAGVPERIGAGVEKFAKVRDERTSELTEKIAAALDRRLKGQVHVVIARFDRKYLDVNRPASGAYESPAVKPVYDAYHAALAAACSAVERDWGHGLLVDIHGQSAEPRAIFRGTAERRTLAHLIDRFGAEALDGPRSVSGALEVLGYKVVPAGGSSDAEDRRFNGGHIVRTYGSGQGGTIDALQLEFGSQLRSRAALDQTATDTASAIETFAASYLPSTRRQALQTSD